MSTEPRTHFSPERLRKKPTGKPWVTIRSEQAPTGPKICHLEFTPHYNKNFST